jgi:hypothetical protein
MGPAGRRAAGSAPCRSVCPASSSGDLTPARDPGEAPRAPNREGPRRLGVPTAGSGVVTTRRDPTRLDSQPPRGHQTRVVTAMRERAGERESKADRVWPGRQEGLDSRPAPAAWAEKRHGSGDALGALSPELPQSSARQRPPRRATYAVHARPRPRGRASRSRPPRLWLLGHRTSFHAGE